MDLSNSPVLFKFSHRSDEIYFYMYPAYSDFNSVSLFLVALLLNLTALTVLAISNDLLFVILQKIVLDSAKEPSKGIYRNINLQKPDANEI